MYVELWSHFKTFLNALYPFLEPSDKTACGWTIKWINNQGNRYSGIDTNIINQAIGWLRSIRDQHVGQVSADLFNCLVFLTRLNQTPSADWYNTQAGCVNFGFHFYDGACHKDPKPATPPYVPELIIPTVPVHPGAPPDIGDGIGDFLGWSNSFLIDFTTNVGRDIAGYANNMVEEWDNVLGGLGVYADIIGTLDMFTDYINYPLDLIRQNFEVVEDNIGVMSKLDGRTIVDAILYVNDKTGDSEEKISKGILKALDLEYSESSDHVSMIGNGLMEDLYIMEQQWEELGEKLGGITIMDVKKVLSNEYDLATGTVQSLKARLDAIEKVITVSIEMVDGEITTPVYPGVEGMEYFIPASVGWVLDVVQEVAITTLATVEQTTVRLAEGVNLALETIFEFPDQWIADLSAKLNLEQSSYSLVDDPVYQAAAELLKETADTIIELPDLWVSRLAEKLEGYFTVGIGEKGEQGEPGVPGAQGIPGIPGVRGEKGEPGEGAGLAIDDINSQLRDKMTQAAGFVGSGLTGVVDTMIVLYGERFSDLQTQITPISEFLTTDMQSTLTVLAESFETPEALIAFLLDVPEGQEGVTFDLMQMLITQIMERGLT